jgi:cullin 1
VDLINKERGGAMVDKALIRSCIEVYEKMGMGTLDAYVADFEAQLLAATRCVYI